MANATHIDDYIEQIENLRPNLNLIDHNLNTLLQVTDPNYRAPTHIDTKTEDEAVRDITR